MGKCMNCGKEVTLKEEETNCDNCKTTLRYRCWNCKEWFWVCDSKGNKIKECKTCGYFYCPNCNVCGESCQKGEWAKKIKDIFGKSYYSILNMEEIAQKIIDLIEEIKVGKEQKNCPFEVPISYAKNRLKGLLVRLEGYKVRNQEDQKEFERRMKEILDKPLGTKFTINQIRENGTYGQEYRDAFNLGICFGELKVIWKENKFGEKYPLFERIEKGHCPKLDNKDLVVAICKNPKCKKIYPKGKKQCDVCVYTKNTTKHKKGEPYETKIKVSNKDICQLNRGEFKKKDGFKKEVGKD